MNIISLLFLLVQLLHSETRLMNVTGGKSPTL